MYDVGSIYREAYDDELDAWREAYLAQRQRDEREPVPTSPWVDRADRYDLPTKELTR